MTDQIDKNLAKFSRKELDIVDALLGKLCRGDIDDLNLIRLKDHQDVFRIRKGRIRIIYRTRNNKITLLSISKRDEKTYKGL